MSHLRNRYLVPRLLKKLKFSPVIAIQGARQTGKSFLARELLKNCFSHSDYLTFDQQTMKMQAETQPHSFLDEHVKAHPLILDEAQKVPIIFEAIKLVVDLKRVPGSYLLLGSTEFSRLSLVRESLTGRMGRVRLFPMTLSETLSLRKNKTPQRSDTMTYLKRGGMPGMFAVRGEQERSELIQDWVDLTCERDIHQFKSLKLDSELAFSILKASAILEEPTQAKMASHLHVDSRRVGTHLKALCALFVLQRLDPHPSGTGKSIFLPLDVGIAGYLGASSLRRLHVFLMNERLCQNQYFEGKQKKFYYYRSIGKKPIHLVEEPLNGPLQAFQVIEHERIKKTDAELMAAFLKKNPKAKGIVYGPIPRKMKVKGCTFAPWEELLCYDR